MSSFKCKVVLIGLLLALAMAVPVPAQTVKEDDGTTLKQIIIFGRHSIRSSTVAPDTLATYSTNVYPPFTGVPVGYLTPNGRQAAGLLGSYFHEYLLHEGLLTGNGTTDLSHSYFRANSIQRSNMTAAKFGEGLIPGVTIPVHSYAIANPDTGAPAVIDPVFDPIRGNIATMDSDRAAAVIQGIFGTGAALTSAYSGEIALIHSVLEPEGSANPTSQPFTLTVLSPVPAAGYVINGGGLDTMINAIDPFVMQYADGFAMEDVAWGRLTVDTLSQITRLVGLQFSIEMQAPYIDQVQSSNAASHILRSMSQVISRSNLRGAFGDRKSQILVIISSDAYVSGLAGLLHLHWQLPGYQPDFCAPGGALVFELRQNNRTKQYLVRVFYTAQTLAQLRNLTALTLDEPPATMQLNIPGGGTSATDLDVKFATFKKLLNDAIGRQYVQPFRQEGPPVIENVPLD